MTRHLFACVLRLVVPLTTSGGIQFQVDIASFSNYITVISLLWKSRLLSRIAANGSKILTEERYRVHDFQMCSICSAAWYFNVILSNIMTTAAQTARRIVVMYSKRHFGQQSVKSVMVGFWPLLVSCWLQWGNATCMFSRYSLWTRGAVELDWIWAQFVVLYHGVTV